MHVATGTPLNGRELSQVDAHWRGELPVRQPELPDGQPPAARAAPAGAHQALAAWSLGTTPGLNLVYTPPQPRDRRTAPGGDLHRRARWKTDCAPTMSTVDREWVEGPTTDGTSALAPRAGRVDAELMIATEQDLLRDCVASATAAPSVHNTQPWLFRIRDDGVDVLVDRRRQLHTIDPDGREMCVSVGAAVFNLRVALGARGLRADVRLAPDWHDDALAARVRIVSPVDVNPAALMLRDAIGRRHTNRRPFADTPIAEPVLTELTTAAALEGA